MDVERYRVKPGHAVKLDAWDAGDKSQYDGDKESAEAELRKLFPQLVYIDLEAD